MQLPSTLLKDEHGLNNSNVKMGPTMGSGAYAQKQKVGVLEPDFGLNSSHTSNRRLSQVTYNKSTAGHNQSFV